MIHGDLSVRINDGRTDKIVSKKVSDLEFGTVAPGGHGSISFHLDAPWADWDITAQTKVYVYDGRTAECLCEGFAEDPGRDYSGDGEGWDITAHGGAAMLANQSQALIYVDRMQSDDAWSRVANVTPMGTNSVTDDPGSTTDDAIVLQLPGGTPVAANSRVSVRYDRLQAAGMKLGGYAFTWDAGKTNASLSVEALVYTNSAGAVVVSTATFNVAGGTIADKVVTNFAVGPNQLLLRIIWTGGATNVVDDLTWGSFTGMSVRGLLLDAAGSEITGANYAATCVYAHQVVNDLLGRVLTFCDGPGARVDVATYQIDNLAYPDGVRASDVLADLTLFEPDLFAEVLESNAAGKHRFNYRAWGTDPRTVLSTGDGYVQPGSETDQANRVAVYWVNSRGIKKTTIVTTVVAGLTGTVDAESVDLGDRAGTTANATRVGGQVLAAQNTVSKAATATVTRDVSDRHSGARWRPWEHRAGYVALVQQTGDLLRVTETRYVDNDEAVTLTLGQPARTREQIIADNTRRRR